MKDLRQNLSRPVLSKEIDIEDFRSFYWLKKELLSFCRENGLPTVGGKREIQKRIEHFLKTGSTVLTRESFVTSKSARIHQESLKLSLDGVVPDHFRCSYEARAFLNLHAGLGFKYTVRLQQYLKANPGITFFDLITEWKQQLEEKKSGLKTDIGPQFEYNQFTRDYFSDPNNQGKTKADCIAVWNTIKKLRGERKYKMSNGFLPTFETIQDYDHMRSRLDVELFKRAAIEIANRHHLSNDVVTLFPDGSNVIFAHGSERVIKIFPSLLRSQFESERLVLKHLQRKLTVPTPVLEHSGEFEGWPYLVMSRVEGETLESVWGTLDFENRVSLIKEIGSLIKEVHSLGVQGLETIDSHWNQFIERQSSNCVDRHKRKSLKEELLLQLPDYVAAAKKLFPHSIVPSHLPECKFSLPIPT